jgi:hypothetical protein
MIVASKHIAGGAGVHQHAVVQQKNKPKESP